MDCVNHSGVAATAFCQNCGKALCPQCVRNGAQGQILCQPCATAWQSVPNPFSPFAAPPPGAPNPSAAAVLGLIPGVGAMYNGQFFKGLIHVVIFAVLVSISAHYPIFGLFIAAWVLYQSFEAYHTARARRDGTPLPDPLGLNEVGNWLNLGAKPPNPMQPPGPASGAQPAAGSYQAPYQAPGQAGYQAPPFTPVGGPVDPNMPPNPPVPPVPPGFYWRRKEPIGAIVLIGLGIMFLLGQLDIFNGRFWDFMWPMFLIGLGAWLMVSRVGPWHGGPK
jgi:hypothetical protein